MQTHKERDIVMKPIYLFTSMLALATVVVTSCSAPRFAQQNTDDDVYNSVAKAREYRQQVPVRESRDSDYDTQEDEYYGASDPYYDMDYSSRINRFYNYRPWNSYYDPYFDNGWYGNYGLSIGLGFGYSPFYGSLWNSPYNAWGNYYSPFGGYGGWGYNNFYGGGYYGGGYGGGLWGGGYWGGGFYTGRTTNVDYRPRPSRGSSNGYRGGRGNEAYLSPRSTARGRGDAVSRPGNNNGISTRPSRTNTTGTPSGRPGSTESSRPSRTESTRPSRTESTRPNRTESTRPASTESSRPTRTESTRPSYSPPPSRSSDGGSGGGRPSGGGGGGGGRPSRGGGR